MVGGWIIERNGKYWQRTANSQHSDAVGEWVENPHCASVFRAEQAQEIADEVGGEPYDYAAACEEYYINETC